MARPNQPLISALRVTAARLRLGDHYQWGHFGRCNCGHLAQTLTGVGRAEIHRAALQRGGDWTDRAREYCPDSGFAIDDILQTMMEAGLSTSDIADLEALSNAAVRKRLPSGRQHLRPNVREDAIEYLETWATLLAEQLRSGHSRSDAA